MGREELEEKAREAAAQYIAELYENYRGLLFSTAYRVCGTELDVEATVNESILRLARHTETLRRLTPSALTVYLVSTVQSVAYNQHRRLGLERRRFLDQEIGSLVLPLPQADPEAMYLEREGRDERLLRLREALAELRESDRDILTEKYFAGMSDRQLAEKYGISEGGVRVRLSRAKKRARAIMERKEGGHERKKR